MLFNSPAFLLFFPVVTIIYFLLRHEWRWIWLLLASCYFYMFFRPVYILILFFTIAIDYASGIIIENHTDNRKRKFWLIISILANAGVLIFFKYINFFNQTLYDLTGLEQRSGIPFLDVVLPIGLSFHTFQAMSYTIEVYRRNQKAERHLGIYSLYVMFYPQLVAGPIERPGHMLPQLHERKFFDYTRASKGLRRMLWGFVKKVVIADRLSFYVNMIFSQPENYSGNALIWATIFFAFQIYCDFSGYCDIAIGAANVMGFDLMENFRLPYLSRNIAQFWSRWHISLSSWFRDYLYIPLGGNQVSRTRWILNILIVFAVSGLWHGAAWTFVTWGILHGLYLIGFRIAGKYFRLPAFFSVIITFIFVSIAWIFFRADSFQQAIYIISHLKPTSTNLIGLPLISAASFVLNFLFIGLLIVSEYIFEQEEKTKRHLVTRPVYRYLLNFAMVMMIIIFGIFEEQTFIYFQF
jgi:alginate O-acetyltransferase complex protein AlgI